MPDLVVALRGLCLCLGISELGSEVSELGPWAAKSLVKLGGVALSLGVGYLACRCEASELDFGVSPFGCPAIASLV